MVSVVVSPVPVVAVSRISGQYFVFVAEAQGDGLVARQRAIQVGDTLGDDYIVRGGALGHGAAEVGEVETVESPVQHPVRVVDLPMAEEVDGGCGHGSSVSNPGPCS